MSILAQIVEAKRKEVDERRSLYPVKLLERSPYFSTPVVSLKKYLLRHDKSGIIAEIKRRSPSTGLINAYAGIEQTSIGYMQAGASALSVLTDAAFFGGCNEDLTTARRFNFCPVLRKDFILDEYQIVEAKSIGADAILLIAAILDTERLKSLFQFATSLGLEVLIEIHSEDELSTLPDNADIIGVNCRDLRTSEVSLDIAANLGTRLPYGALRVAESGIRRPEDVHRLRENGFQGFLIGEAFMRHSRPDVACRTFIAQLTQQKAIDVTG